MSDWQHRQWGERLTFHPGDFLHNPIPQGYDCVTLVIILHDHDDEPVLHLLKSIRDLLAPGGRLVIAEPMAGTRGAKAMEDAHTLASIYGPCGPADRARQRKSEECSSWLASRHHGRSTPGFR